MHKLIIEDDEGKTVVVPLIRDEITVGRQEGNTVRLTEQNISRRHARLIRENGVLSVEDVGSYNGITVNGARIKQKQPLKDGDEIAIGDYKFGVKIEGADKTLGYDAAVPFQAGASGRAVVAPATAPEPAREIPAAPDAAASPSVPQEEMDGAPTIPVRTLADQEREAASALVGKLVVISSAFSGHEFLLDRPSLVIGRTPENDVVLNHKSISRHHAKIIRDGNYFVIVDLESANGVRVNGSTEERAQLDHGDTVELGHVRMRFLAGADADSAAAFEGVGRSKKPMIIGAGVAAVVGIVLVIVFSGGGKDGKDKGTAAAQTTTAAPPATAAAPQKSATALLSDARRAYDDEKWDVAAAALRKAAELDPGAAQASELAGKIDLERAGAEKLAALKTEAAAGNLETARAAAGAIPEASRFKGQAAALVTLAQTNYVAGHLRAAEEQRTRGVCDAARAEVDLVLAVEPDNTTAKEVITLCKQAARRPAVVARREPAPAPVRRAAAAAAPVVRPVAAAPARPAAVVKTDPPPSEAEPAGDPDEFIRKATDSWLRGQFAAAIDASRTALKIKPGLMRAYQIIAVCSCSLRDEGAAGKAYEKLDAKNRGMVKTLCQKNGIALE